MCNAIGRYCDHVVAVIDVVFVVVVIVTCIEPPINCFPSGFFFGRPIFDRLLAYLSNYPHYNRISLNAAGYVNTLARSLSHNETVNQIVFSHQTQTRARARVHAAVLLCNVFYSIQIHCGNSWFWSGTPFYHYHIH